MSASTSVFLRAEWRHLAMLSFEIDPQILEPFVPPPLELDFWQGKTYLSLVGFMFESSRLFGIRIPFHQSFPEVNLRFYVLRRTAGGQRRGVVFLREIAARRCVGLIARRFYHESYLTLPVRHEIEIATQSGEPSRFDYSWRFKRRWNKLRIGTAGEPIQPARGSLDEFIVDHDWAYTRERNGRCREYFVERPPWPVRRAINFKLDCDAPALYGPALGAALESPAASAFVAEGSSVAVHRGVLVEVAARRSVAGAESAKIPTTCQI